MHIIGSDAYTLVVGLGKTGFACANFLAKNNQHVVVMDSRIYPPYLQQLQKQHPNITIHLGQFNADICAAAKRIVLSPGVAIAEPAIHKAKQLGVSIISDIDLFRAAIKAPLVAITGSNAKSTVTSLVGDMAKRAGLNVAVGGNLGVPAVDLLDDSVQLYVMELSSFQLETTHHLNAHVATVLNISEDHMDRYPNIAAYHRAKHRIFHGCQQVVINADDMLVQPLVASTVGVRRFTLKTPDIHQYGLIKEGTQQWLARGSQRLLNVDKLAMQGSHNYANCLAAMALGESVHLPMSAMLASVQNFSGLAHRCQLVTTINGVAYINDSKGTNVGAAIAAIEGFAAHIKGRIILLAGGVGKGADFSALSAPLKKYGCIALLYGQDSQLISQALGDVSHTICTTLTDALLQAKVQAHKGDLVLLSPACASFDDFDNFEHRGQVFTEQVHKLAEQNNHVHYIKNQGSRL